MKPRAAPGVLAARLLDCSTATVCSATASTRRMVKGVEWDGAVRAPLPVVPWRVPAPVTPLLDQSIASLAPMTPRLVPDDGGGGGGSSVISHSRIGDDGLGMSSQRLTPADHLVRGSRYKIAFTTTRCFLNIVQVALLTG